MKKLLTIVLLGMAFIIGPSAKTEAKELTNNQKEICKTIYKVCLDNYDEYGVLPSVCMGQAFVESTLGEHCSGYNLWGIRSGAESYDCLEDGVLRYLEVINNGYYDGALFNKSYEDSICNILQGGYCEPVGNYYADFIYLVEEYELYKYDQKMFRTIEKRKYKKKLLSGDFTIVNDPTIPEGYCYINQALTKSGACEIILNDQVIDILDVTGKSCSNVIRVNWPELDGTKVEIKVHNAKG